MSGAASPARQYEQVPQAMVEPMTTRSPGFRLWTSRPTASTTPTPS
jgi:hypothetical protein